MRIVVVALALLGASGCAWETGDDPVYYEHAPKHQLSGTPASGVGTTNEQVAPPDPNAPAVQVGVTNSVTGPAQPTQDPEPSPWLAPKNQKITPPASIRYP